MPNKNNDYRHGGKTPPGVTGALLREVDKWEHGKSNWGERVSDGARDLFSVRGLFGQPVGNWWDDKKKGW